MPNLVPPHGADALRPLLLPETERVEEARRAGQLKRVPLSSRELSYLFMLGMGAYTPLGGFMGEVRLLRALAARRRPVLADPDHVGATGDLVQ